MIIPYLNSIRFRKVDSNYTNFDNTLTANERFFNDSIFSYCQRFLTTDTVKIQIKSNSDTVPTVTLTKSDKTTVSITATLVSSYDQNNDGTNDLFFFEFDVVMSGYTTYSFLTVEQDGETWKSETFFADSDLLTELQSGESVKIEYYNDDNAFNVDFSTGITFFFYLEGLIKDLDFGGESSIYDNQDELTKLKETATRVLRFVTLSIPRYVAELVRLASSCDNFVINGISYIREDLPELTPVEGSNLVDLSTLLTDKEYLGVNSHDIGFDCDTPATEGEIMILTELNASGSVSFLIPAGYMVHTLRGQWVSGTTVEMKLGTSLAGSELVYPVNLTSTVTDLTVAIHGDVDRDSDATIYATVTGGVANLDLQLIQNKQ